MATEVKRGNYAAYLAAGTTTVFTGACRIHKVIVTTASTTANTVFDSTAASGNKVLVTIATPTAGTIFDLDAPMDNGITVTVGTSGTLVVLYSQHK